MKTNNKITQLDLLIKDYGRTCYELGQQTETLSEYEEKKKYQEHIHKQIIDLLYELNKKT